MRCPFSVFTVLLAILSLLSSSQAVLSSVDQQAATDAHNTYRAMEGASNMLQMSWDPYLASVAQAYAQQCIFSHNSARSTQYTAAAGTNAVASYVGENLYVTSGGDTPGLVGSAIQAWYSEKSGYNLTTNSCSGVCGHYTQIVWAQSYLVGCGSSYCQSVSGFNSAGTIIVCDYAPGGNYVGQVPYTRGTTCSACPAQWPYCYNNALCSKTPTQTQAPGSVTASSASNSAKHILLMIAVLLSIII
ncbi:hypothetical protein EMCRGX_G004839 [Ephydatia muelleri]|eukprot:Em0007g739a